MKQLTVILSAALAAASAMAQQGAIGHAFLTPDRALAAVNQSPEGTWLLELRRGGGQPPVLAFMTYNRDGTVVGSAAVATQSSHHGVWVRVGDRRFLQTMMLFGFNEAGALASITKVRINVRLSQDGTTLSGTQEVVVMDPEGRVIATIPGGTHTGVRLNPEKPADFDDFGQQP